MARFAELVADGDGHLDEMALCISGAANPGVDVRAELSRIDAVAVRCHDAGVGDPDGLCRYLFTDAGAGLSGNRRDYYDVRNSYLDSVLSRRRGIPITLSVLAIEVGRRLGIGLVGIGMPGHFLVRGADDPDAFHDPFNAGLRYDRAGLGRFFASLHGAAVPLAAEYLEPVGTRVIAERMLANLTRIHLESSDHRAVATVLRLRALLPGAEPAVSRQLAGVLAHLGRSWEAAEIHERLVGLQPSRADEHRAAAQRLRAGAN